jgi:hypothetical protein
MPYGRLLPVVKLWRIAQNNPGKSHSCRDWTAQKDSDLLAVSRDELRQCHALAAVFENDSNRHIDMNLVNRAADDIAAEARTFIEIDPGSDVGNVRSEAPQRLTDHFSDYGEGKYLAFATDFHPLEFVAGAIATNRSRAKHPAAAVLAFLNHQLAGSGAVPERLIHRRYFRKRLFDYPILITHIKFSPFESQSINSKIQNPR